MIHLLDVLRRFRRDEGLGLVEVIAAMGVVFVVLLGLAYTTTVALNDIGLGRQRQAANGLANTILEQARALPYSELTTLGLNTGDVAADSSGNIASCGGGVYRLGSCPSGEVIVHSSRSSPAPPLVPHICETGDPVSDCPDLDIADSPAQFTRAVYVSEAPPTANGQVPYRVTVIVSWDQTFRLGTDNQVETDTLVFQPSGGGPGFRFNGDGDVSQGRISISGSIQSQDVAAALNTVGAEADAVLDPVRTVNGRSRGSKVSLSEPASASGTLGGQSAASLADNDPATPMTTRPPYSSELMSASNTGSLSTSESGVTFTVSRTETDSGSSTSAMAAGDPDPTGTSPSGLQDCPLDEAIPPSETDGQPCGEHHAQQGGTLSADVETDLTVNVGDTNVNVNLFTSLASAQPLASGNPTWALTNHEIVSSGAGRIEVEAERRLGEITLVELDPALAPSSLAWDGYLLRLSNYRDTATAQAGAGALEPSCTIDDDATLEYWNGSGYETHTLGSAGPIPVAGLSTTANIGGLVPVSLFVEADLSSEGTVEQSNIPDSGTAQCGSPIVGTVTYELMVNGSPVTQLDMDVDLNELTAAADRT